MLVNGFSSRLYTPLNRGFHFMQVNVQSNQYYEYFITNDKHNTNENKSMPLALPFSPVIFLRYSWSFTNENCNYTIYDIVVFFSATEILRKNTDTTVKHMIVNVKWLCATALFVVARRFHPAVIQHRDTGFGSSRSVLPCHHCKLVHLWRGWPLCEHNVRARRI